MIHIRLNGQDQNIPEELNLAQLLERLQVDPCKVAVAKNLEVVVRSDLGHTRMREGDEIEIFQAVGGG
jgi:thiamine biosynthesis protein ThiS